MKMFKPWLEIAVFNYSFTLLLDIKIRLLHKISKSTFIKIFAVKWLSYKIIRNYEKKNFVI